jgi:hypothetical protein
MKNKTRKTPVEFRREEIVKYSLLRLERFETPL